MTLMGQALPRRTGAAGAPPSGGSAQPPASATPGAARRVRAVVLTGLVLLGFGGLVVAGTIPRLRRHAVLARDAQEVSTAAPQVQVVTPRASADGSLVLPGTIQAIRQTSVGARASGTVRSLPVDIGSHVRAGQLLAEIGAPELDQQVAQAASQTDQSRAAVSQAQATVQQQQAVVAQNQATVRQNQAAVQQAYAQVDSFRSKLAQAQAVKLEGDANLVHAKHVLTETQANLNQQQAQLLLTRVNYHRDQVLVARGFLDKQTADTDLTAMRAAQAQVATAQAAVRAAQADVDAAMQAVAADQAAIASATSDLTASQKNAQATESALAAAEQVVRATQASVRANQENVRANQALVSANQALVSANQAGTQFFSVMRGYQQVLAPFDGVITSRNVDVGTLVTANATAGISSSSSANATAPTTGLFGIAETDSVKVDVNVPQTFAAGTHPGTTVQMTVRELPGRTFAGTVTLRAGALDSTSRTQLVEVGLPNRDGALAPGMYAEAKLTPAGAASLRIPGTALRIDAHGTRVAALTKDDRIRFRSVRLGRDFGREVEILDGVQPGEQLVNNPSDLLQDGEKVQAQAAKG